MVKKMEKKFVSARVRAGTGIAIAVILALVIGVVPASAAPNVTVISL